MIAARKLSSAMSAAKAASDHMKSWFGWVVFKTVRSDTQRYQYLRLDFSLCNETTAGAPLRTTGWVWESSAMAAMARPRASCSGATWQGFTFFFNYVETNRCSTLSYLWNNVSSFPVTVVNGKWSIVKVWSTTLEGLQSLKFRNTYNL